MYTYPRNRKDLAVTVVYRCKKCNKSMSHKSVKNRKLKPRARQCCGQTMAAD